MNGSAAHLSGSRILSSLAFSIFLFFSSSAFSLTTENRLPNEAQEQRAMNLFLQVRCLVRKGQVIENSDSEFSIGMRELIRKKISEGKSDDEIKSQLISEFGEDIITKPDIKHNFILWAFPLIFASAAAIFLRRKFFKN